MDIERTMQFIVDHQAAHAAAIAEHDERLKEQQQVIRQIEGLLVETIQTVRVGAEMTMSHADAIAKLLGAQEETRRRVNDLTDDVHALVKVVDGLVRHRDENAGGPNTPSV